MRVATMALGAVLAAGLLATPAFGTMVASEDFGSYTAGTSLNGLGTAGGGWAGGWYVSTAFAFFNVPAFVVATPAHTFSPDYTSPAGGQTANMGFTRLFRELTAPTSNSAPTYVSFIAPANAMSQVDLNMGRDDDNARVVGIQWANGGQELHLMDGRIPTGGAADPNTENYDNIILGMTSAADADLYVIKLDPTTGMVGYYVFLNGTSPISGTADMGLEMINDASRGVQFDRLGLFTINSAGVSDIRIGTTAADVGVSENALVGRPVPEPASLGLLALGGLALLRRRR